MAKGNIKQIHAFRMKPGDDFLLTLQKYCEDNEIKNGIILNTIGSLDGATFLDPVPLPEKKFGYGYGEPIKLFGPIEILTADGMVCHNDDEEILLHVHVTYSDQDGHAYGGHLIEGNRVLFTADVVLGEIENINMMRRYDDDLEVEIFSPE